MAHTHSESSNSLTVLAVLAMTVLGMIAAFIAWQAGAFGGSQRAADLEVNTPGETSR